MSFGGILATALAGGAGVVSKQAGDDIEQGRKTDLMRQQAAIEEQTQTRLAELRARLSRQSNKDTLADTLAFNSSDETIAATGKVAKAAGATARDVERERLGDTALNEAARKKATDDAKAAADASAGILKSQAADPAYLKSINVLKLADPEVRARIAALSASASASAQQVKESAERLKQLQAVGEVATKVRGIQDLLAKAADPAQRQALEQQITDLGFSGKDVKSFLATAERAMTNGDTAMKVLLDPMADAATKDAARAQLERANEFAAKAAGLAGIKLADPKAAEPPATAVDHLRKNPNLKAEFDAKYGKGAASRALDGQDPAKKPAASGQSRAAASTSPMLSSFSGVEGLSDLALKRIAEDPANPLQATAVKRLQSIAAERGTSNRARVNDDASDPSLYQ